MVRHTFGSSGRKRRRYIHFGSNRRLETMVGFNYIVLRGLNAGEHTVSLSIDPEKKGYDFNMSHGREDANDCHIDCLKLIRL